MDYIIENEHDFMYKQIIRFHPIEHHYEQFGEKPYIKYGCPICEQCGLKHQIHPCDIHCPNCGVNILWDM